MDSKILAIDKIIEKLLNVRGCTPGKKVLLTYDEITLLCSASREIFINQPALLELDSPIKICGKIKRLIFKEIYMDNIMIFYVYLNILASLPRQTIYF